MLVLWKESLNSDGQQLFHQYQQPQIILHKKNMTCNIGNLGLDLGQAQRHGGVKHLLFGIPILPTLDNWVFNDNTDINKQ